MYLVLNCYQYWKITIIQIITKEKEKEEARSRKQRKKATQAQKRIEYDFTKFAIKYVAWVVEKWSVYAENFRDGRGGGG